MAEAAAANVTHLSHGRSAESATATLCGRDDGILSRAPTQTMTACKSVPSTQVWMCCMGGGLGSWLTDAGPDVQQPLSAGAAMRGTGPVRRAAPYPTPQQGTACHHCSATATQCQAWTCVPARWGCRPSLISRSRYEDAAATCHSRASRPRAAPRRAARWAARRSGRRGPCVPG